MVSGEERGDREIASQLRAQIARRVDKRLDAMEHRLAEMTEKQAELHAENREEIAEIKLKMAVIHYKVGLICGLATTMLTLIGGVILKRLGLV